MLDRHSEIIAHFIGIFDQAAEQSLFRLQYDAFRAQHRPNEEPGRLLDIDVRVSSQLLADKYYPGQVDLLDHGTALGLIPADVGLHIRPVEWVEPGFLPFSDFVYTFERDQDLPGFVVNPGTQVIGNTPDIEIAPPGGFILFVYEQNILVDNDTLLARPLELSPELAASRTDAALDAAFMPLAATADALMPGNFTLARDVEDTGARIETLREVFAGVDPDDALDGATVTIVSQMEGSLPESGILVDGVAADSLPETLKEELDARGLGFGDDDEEEEEEDEAEDTDTDDTDDSDDSDGVVVGTVVIHPDETGPQDGATQTIVAGDNLLINDALSGFYIVDASVIAVAGKAASYTVVSQVNVMSDRDTLVGLEEALCTGKDHPFSKGASEGHNIASVRWEGASRGEPGGDGPVGFGITEIKGDLVLTTHVFQLNLVTDNDVIAFETTVHQVEIGTGGNFSFNVLDVLNFQTAFDMILVGGDMLNLVSVSQMNLLFDNDLIVDGDGVGGDIQSSGNLLWNEANITWQGIDTAADKVSDSAAEALATMAGGQIDLGALKGEALLAGKEVPLLLTVGGNLVFDYRVEQINILADADTVQLFADAAAENGFNRVDVDTGDNLLANVVNLEIQGTDSTIMATHGVFSDLVIYQAGMYDTDDAPQDLNGAGSDLASEAVVFLADGMIDGGHGAEPEGGDVFVDTGGSSSTFDTLGGVIA